MRRRYRVALGLVGVAVLGVAALVVAVPAVSDSLPADPLVDAVGYDYVLAAAVGVVAVILVVAVLALRGLDGIEQATMPEPETVQHAVYPGARFDRTVSERVRFLPGRPTEEEQELRERVRRAAERAVVRRENVSRERATEAVERGEWTDDATAAAFVSEERRPPIRTRLVALVTPRSWFQLGARRAAEEVYRLDGGGEADGTNRPSPERRPGGDAAGGAR